jgi:hypothetical protein
VVKAETTNVAVRSVPWWHWALVSIVMFSLVLTLATRTFHVTLSYNTTVQSGDSQAVRQHMDRDAIRWAGPVARVTVSQAFMFYSRVAPAGPLPTLFLEKSLYNRPPPTS